MAKIINPRKLRSAFISKEEHTSIMNSIINNSSDAIIFAIDTKYRYIVFNELHSAEMKNSYNVTIKVGDKILDYFDGEEIKSNLKESMDRALKGEKFSENLKINDKCFDYKWSSIIHNDEIIGASVVINDISEKVKSKLALRRSEKDFKNVFDYSTIGKSITEIGGEIRANRAFCEMLGYTEKELKAVNWQEITHPDDVENDKLFVESILAGERESARWEKRYIHKNGSIVWADVGTYLQRDADNKPLYFITSLVNITHRKIAEKERQESERKYYSLFNNSVIGMFRSKIDGTGFLMANKKLCEIFEYTEKELLSKPSALFWAKAEKRNEMVDSLLNLGIITNFEVEVVSSNGTIKNCLCNFKYDAGKDYFDGSLIDITELKTTKSKLIKSEENQNLILKSLPVAIYVSPIDPDVDTIWISENIKELSGYTSTEFISVPYFWRHKIHPDDLEKVILAFSNLSEHKSISVEYRWRVKTGEYRWFLDKASLNSENEFFGIIIDITEQKLLNIALSENEHKYKNLIENMMEGLIVADNNDEIIFVNEQFCKLTGYKEEELIGKITYDILLSDYDKSKVVKSEDKRTFNLNQQYELEMIKKSGETILLQINTTPIQNSFGEVVGSMATCMDITERKKAEEGLKKSEELYRTVVSSANDGIILQERSGKILTWNDTAEKIFNVKKENIIGEYANEMYWDTYKEDGSFFETMDHPSYVTFTTGNPCENVIMGVKHTNPDNFYWVKVNTNPLFTDNSTKPSSVIITFTDITEQKNSIDLLRKSEEKYRTLITEASDGILILDSDGSILEMNQSGVKITGHSTDELIGKNLHKLLQTSSRENQEDNFKKLQTGLSVLLNHNILRKDGSMLPVEINAKMLFDGKILAIVRDVKERTRKELLTKSRLLITDFASRNNLKDTLRKVIDIAEEMTQSNIGFFHFVNDNQQDISLQVWSTNTREKMCKAVPEISHYKLSDAGVWADCARIREPIIHNDYPALENKHGLPDGHSEVIRQITVPVIRSDKIKAIIGVGNRKTLYTSDDAEFFSNFCDGIWDLIEKKINEELLIESESSLKVLNAEKDKFFSIIAHDLRSPFSGFLGLTQMMTESIDDFSSTELSSISKNLNSSAKNLLQLLNNLLEWSSVQRGMMKFNPVELDLTALMQKCLNDEDEIIKKKELKVEVKIEEGMQVFADLQMIETINRNLISNAVKFSNHDEVISISAEECENNFVRVSIKDNGIGMSKEIISKLFKIQEVVTRKGTEGELSSGIGLLLCKEFVNKHNGEIWAESEEGKGSKFCYTIPKA